jgi:hypothetical protein
VGNAHPTIDFLSLRGGTTNLKQSLEYFLRLLLKLLRQKCLAMTKKSTKVKLKAVLNFGTAFFIFANYRIMAKN